MYINQGAVTLKRKKTVKIESGDNNRYFIVNFVILQYTCTRFYI